MVPLEPVGKLRDRGDDAVGLHARALHLVGPELAGTDEDGAQTVVARADDVALEVRPVLTKAQLDEARAGA